MESSRFKKTAPVLFVLFLFTFNSIFAQTSDTIKIQHEKSGMNTQLAPSILFPDNSFNNLLKRDYSFSNFLENESDFSTIFLSKNKKIKAISFELGTESEILTGLGGYEYFNNTFNYNLNNKIVFDFGVGLLKQNSIMTPFKPIFNMAFDSEIEYFITPWLSTYLYGQFVVPTLNKSNKIFDPFTYMNPMFFQTEAGGGLRAKFKNVKADVGMKKMYDTQFRQSNPVQYMDTKVTIGF